MRYKIWICPTCNGRYRKSTDAYKCIKKHQPRAEDWWECQECGYGIRTDGRAEASIQAEIENHKKIACCGNKYDLWRYIDV